MLPQEQIGLVWYISNAQPNPDYVDLVSKFNGFTVLNFFAVCEKSNIAKS